MSVLLPPSSTAKPKPRKSSSPIYRTIVPTSEKVSQTWKYTFAAPPAAWHQKDFNDSKWHTGQGGFGTHITPHIGRLGTVWKTSDIWLRRTFNPGTITAVPINVRDYHDEAVEIYINGTLVYSAKGYIVGYERKPLAAGAHRAIMSNAKNVMAVHCHQTTGGQYIDVGLEQVIAPR
ncbi:MAG: hypothetical protein JOZ57_15965 [Abitibacteriaceae bacterium]|nr:hypothetical protein [Abditibacteriaceae bacterium]